MSKNDKTQLQRKIVLTWYEHPDWTNKRIAEACDCSASYVSTVKNRFDDYNEMEYMMDRQEEEMAEMFGGDIFSGSPSTSSAATDVGTIDTGPGLAESWDDLPNNIIGHIIRAFILLVTLYFLYEAAMILLM